MNPMCLKWMELFLQGQPMQTGCSNTLSRQCQERGKLYVGKRREEYVLNLGHMDPLNELIGIQKRLNNLGFHCGPANGVLGPRTTDALKTFQKKHNLPESGEADEATKNKLTEVYGS